MKQKIVLIALMIGILQSVSVSGITTTSKKNKDVVELQVREGLPNFFRKAENGDTVRVAYLGGSITAQNGWRGYSFSWFQQNFPNAKWVEINAAIGGTGSDFGVFRLKEHVLAFKPDLVFVEFAVNDDQAPADKVTRSMEGIVRQIWQQNPNTDICFIYTVMEDYLEDEMKGQIPASAKTMERVASKYGIPSIDFGFEVCSRLKSKSLIFKDKDKEKDGTQVFSADGVHPYLETGQAIYFLALKRSFNLMSNGKHQEPQMHSLPDPLAKDYFSNTNMIDLNRVQLSQNWTMFNPKDVPAFSEFGKYLKVLHKAGQTGETISFRFKGKTVGAFDMMGPDAGRVIVQIDGEVKDTFPRFDMYCTYLRMSFFLIDHLENKEHEVVFKVLSEPIDKVTILLKHGDEMKNPDDYRENNWYVGKILMDGELIIKD